MILINNSSISLTCDMMTHKISNETYYVKCVGYNSDPTSFLFKVT